MPEVLREYARRMGLDEKGWQLLRGEEQETRDIAAKYGVMVQRMDDGQFVHNVTSLQLIDANRNIRKVYSMGEEMDTEEILKDIDSLLADLAFKQGRPSLFFIVGS